MKRVLITGGTGFVGANLAHRLVEQGDHVTLLVRPSCQHWRIAQICTQAHINVVELNDTDGVRRAVYQARPDWVFHLAVYGAYPTQKDIRRMVDTNLLGTINLVEACLDCGIEAFVQAGSSSEYGFKDHAPSEQEWLEPNSGYSVTKAAATHYCRYLAQEHKAPLTTLRLYSVYGPYEEPTRLIPTLIREGMQGRLPPLAQPDIARDFIYTDDVVEAFLLAAQHAPRNPGAVYNLGTGTQTTLAQVVAAAREVMGLQIEPVWGSMAARCWDTSVWVADNSRIQLELGWRPRTRFPDGLARTVAWLRRFPGREQIYLCPSTRAA